MNGSSFAEGYAIGRDQNGGNGNGGLWGNDGIWAILLLALLGFGGRGGYGFGGYSGGGSEFVGYELGKVATQADIASGFNNSATLNGINSIKENQLSMQNFINQGFAGLNTQLVGEFRNIDNAICTLGYQNQAGFNTFQRAIDGVNYNIAKQTCDIITNANANTQRIVDYLQNEKIEALRAENVALKGKISNAEQSAYLLNELKPCPKAAYIVPNPNCCYNPCGTGAVL